MHTMNFIMKEIKSMYEIYTDGSTRKNGREGSSGGWAYVVVVNGEMDCYDNGFEAPTTNQRMELTAAINACEFICHNSIGFEPIIIYSDSAYLINCIKQNWWCNWQRNGWINSKKEPVANKDLWEKLIPYFNKANISWKKVKGHAGETYNEMADQLARGIRS